MNDLISEEDVLQSKRRSDSFITEEKSICGKKVRPFTAGSLLICKRVGNSLVTGGASESAEFDVLSFIYIHTAPTEQVRKASFSKELFWAAVTEWADGLSVTDMEKAGSLVEKIIAESGVGIVSAKSDDKGGESPN